ncbi:MAG TPA: LysM peptidoglycan-binding domain-containing protein [Anaerolineaceae bacterium]|nr:LysM peptidoglycan-binding domain-containing protein [Anaerolineaceae bacterium]
MAALKVVLALTFVLLLASFAGYLETSGSTPTQPVLNLLDPGACGSYYFLQPGDTLDRLAARCNITVSDILVANPWIRNIDLITPGVRINLPVSNAVLVQGPGAAGSIPVTSGGSPVPQSSAVTYTILPGDTLSSIAARFGTTIAVLMQLNPTIQDPDWIYAGQILNLP